MASKSFEKLIQEIGNMSVFELNDFVKEIETQFGVSAAMPVGAVSAAAPVAAAAPQQEEKAEYKVTLQDSGDKKLEVIKALRKEIPGLSLTDAKTKVESTPSVLAEAASKEDAEKIKKGLEAAGAKVQLS